MIDDKEKVYLSKIAALEQTINELMIEMQQANDRIADFARHELLITMQNLSEDAYCAGWMEGLEQACIDLVDGKLDRYGMLAGDRLEEYRERLAKLHGLAGGWWVFDKEIWRKFIPDGERSNENE